MLAGCSSEFVTANRVRLHVVTAGDPKGRPVVLLHGFPEFWYAWRHQVPVLAEAGFHVLVPDQRGYNLSERPRGARAYRLEELVGDVLGLLDHYGCERVCLAGHDWGAAVAWSLALNSPARLDKLAALNVPHPAVMAEFVCRSPRQMLKSWYIAFFQIPGLADWLLRLGNFAGASRLLTSSGKPGTFSPDDIAEYKQAWSNSGGLTGMIDWYRAVVRYPLPMPQHPRLRVPALVLWGKGDLALSAEMAERSLELCDDGRLVYYENASHWVQHDEAEAVNRELIAFFKS
jgi:pimeloyl-ACP methyl ester carboxylesterase